MIEIAEQIIKPFMAEVRAELEARPKHKIMNFAFTLKDIEEMKIGVDVRAVFEQHIRDLLPSAKVMVRGYPGGGYNITAHVDMR